MNVSKVSCKYRLKRAIWSCTLYIVDSKKKVISASAVSLEDSKVLAFSDGNMEINYERNGVCMTAVTKGNETVLKCKVLTYGD